MIIHHYLSLSIIVHPSIYPCIHDATSASSMAKQNQRIGLFTAPNLPVTVDCGQSQDSHNGIGWDRLKTTALPAGKSAAKAWLNGI